ncbi:MAG: alpha/beta hydrolase fold domain-containing protein [Chlamydiota bacterium]
MKKLLFSFMLAAPLMAHVPDWSFENVEQGWNCDLLTKTYFHYSETQRQWAWELLGKVPFRGDEKVLDFGCGDGKISAEMSRLVPRGSVSGVDLSSKMLQLAQRKFPSYAYPNLDFRKSASLVFSDHMEDTSYDVICAFTVFHLVDKPLEVLKNLRSHLKAEGKLLLVIPTGNNTILYEAADEIFLKYGITSPRAAARGIKRQTMRTVEGCSYFLEEAGYKIESVEIVETKNAFYDVEEFIQWMVGTVSANWNIPSNIGYAFFRDLANKMCELDPSMMNPDGSVFFNNSRIHAVAMPINLMDDPKFSAFIDSFIEAFNPSDPLSLEDTRKVLTEYSLSQETVYEPVKSIENIKILGSSDHSIPLRVFIPEGDKPLPVVLYFHGGGWVFGNIEQADAICRKLANRLGSIIVSVEYRLAPEYPFPKPLEDCYEAAKWAFENISYLGGDPNQLIVCGESAGGNLAGAVALMSKDRKDFPLSAQLLIYPVISASMQDASYDNCADQVFLTKDTMRDFWNMYLQAPDDAENPYASLDQAEDLSNLPPTLIITAEYDPLRLEAKRYARALEEAGVKVDIKCFPKVIHGFIDFSIYENQQRNLWIEEIAERFKELRVSL